MKTQEQIKTQTLLKFIDLGYTIKKETDSMFRMFTKRTKLYLVEYSGKWSIGEVNNYTNASQYITKPEAIRQK